MEVITYCLPRDMNLDEPEFVFESDQVVDESEYTYYIAGLSLSSEFVDYATIDGTSMATPAVAGEVAVVAAKWPDDSVARRAARIIGSTKYCEELKDTSRTEGIANVRKALSCDYVPVVNKATLEQDGKLKIEGYFFGEDKGSVSIISQGSPVEIQRIDEWNGQDDDDWKKDGNDKNAEDIITLILSSGACPDGEVMVKVTSEDGKTGSRMLAIRNAGDLAADGSLYKKLPEQVPNDDTLFKSFSRTRFYNAVGLDGYIYFFGYQLSEDGSFDMAFRYSLSENVTTSRWEKLDQIPPTDGDNICVWNRRIAFFDDLNLKLYSPDDNTVYDMGVIFPGGAYRITCLYLVNAANELYYIMSRKIKDANGEYGEEVIELYKIDTAKSCSYKMYTLKSKKEMTVQSVIRDEETGKTVIYALSKKDDSSLLSEKITIDRDRVSSEYGEPELPANCHFDELNLWGAGNQYGIVLTGPADEGDNTDNFLYDYETGSIEKCDKKITAGRPGNTVVAEYKGKTYFLSLDMYSDEGVSFVWADDDEFKGSGEKKDPLPCYGDEEVVPIKGGSTIVDLKAANDGTVAVGKSIGITPELIEKDGRKITYTWSSDDSGIASVDQSGKVTGKMKGNTYIHAAGKDDAGNVYEGKCSIEVIIPAKSLKLNKNKLTVTAGSEFKLIAAITPADADPASLEWTVSAPEGHREVLMKTEVGDDDAGSYACFETYDTDEDVQVTITASMTDGSNKKASCIVTIVKPSGDVSLPVKSAALSETGTIYLGAGMEHNISLVRMKPENCSDYTVKWNSSNPDVASVSGNETDGDPAVIKGEKKGTAKITALITNTAPGGKRTITVRGLTVKVAQSDLSGNSVRIFNKKKDITGTEESRLAVGKSLTLKALGYQDDKALKAGKTKILWTSSDPERASVAGGKVKAYMEGEVTFTATLVPTGALAEGSEDPVSASCTFYIYNPIKKLSLVRYNTKGSLVDRAPKSIRVSSGTDVILVTCAEVAASGTQDTEREEKKYEWTSSNTDVAKFDDTSEGQVYIETRKAGKAVITCKALDGSNKTVKCRITVYDKVKGIGLTAKKLGSAKVDTFNAEEITVSGLANKKSFTLQANLRPSTANNKAVIYTSSNPSAVTVNKKGLVKRVGAGSADIYVTTVEGGYTAVCHVE